MAETEKVTDIQNIYDILSKELEGNELVKIVELHDYSAKNQSVVVYTNTTNESENNIINETLDKLIIDNNIDRSYILVTPYNKKVMD